MGDECRLLFIGGEWLRKGGDVVCDVADMLVAKGPGDGIPANHLGLLVGRVAAVDVEADTLLPPDALAWQPASTLDRDGVGTRA